MGNEYLEHEEGSMGSFDRTEEINALKAELAEAEHAYNSKVNILGADNTALRSLLTEVNNDNEKIAIAAGEINEQRDALRKERDALRGNSLVCWLRDHPQITTFGELFVYFKVLASIPIEKPRSLIVTFSIPLLKQAGDEIAAIKDDKK